jgi:hypothetical protein
MPFDGVEAPFGYVEKLDQVIDLIQTPGKWVKHAYRTPGGRYCLKEALNMIGVADVFEPVILKAAEEVTERDFCCIESFNDHPLTCHGDVVATLQQMRTNILAGKAALPDGALTGAREAAVTSRVAVLPSLWRRLFSCV